MGKVRVIIALVAALSLVGCQTLDSVTVNGMNLDNGPGERDQSRGCGWVCVGLGIAGSVAIGTLVAGGGNHGGRAGVPGGGGSGGIGASSGSGSVGTSGIIASSVGSGSVIVNSDTAH